MASPLHSRVASPGSDDPPPSEGAELVAVSEVIIEPGSPADGGVLRLVQVGNPAYRPPLPDLSREGEHELPGRVSLEVPSLGVRCGDRWLPPGLYRLALATDGVELRLRARPLAPGRDIDLAAETGTMTSPAARFRCHLAERHVERNRTVYLHLRWGALALEVTIDSPPSARSELGGYSLALVPELRVPAEEVYLGEIARSAEEARGARWLRTETKPRLRLERERHRRLFGLRREYLARVERLASLAKSALEAGDEAEGARIGRIAASYDERAAQLEPTLAALDGGREEIVGVPRPAAGTRVAVSLVEREGEVRLVIDSPAGGAEFRLGERAAQ